jgi:hypothetical protein
MIFAQRSQAGAGPGLGLRRGGISKVGEMKPNFFFAHVTDLLTAQRTSYEVRVRIGEPGRQRLHLNPRSLRDSEM